MRTSLFLPSTLVLFASLHAGSASAIEIETDVSVRHQAIEGWGTALWRDTSNDPRYRSAYRDAGMNIIRLDMAKEVLVTSSNDFATPIPLGDDLQSNVDLMNFRANSHLIAKAEFVQWLKENAPEPERVTVAASPWTAPHWMKGPTGATQNFVGVTDDHPTPFLSNMVVPWQQHNPIPSGDSVGGRLRTEDPAILKQYGEYLAAWVTGFEQEYGVAIDVMSLQNESTFENPFDSMVLHIDENQNTDYGQYALALASVRDAWQQHEIATKIKGPHVAQVGPTPQSPWSLLAQNNYIQAVKDASDPTLIEFLDYYNSNYYMPFEEAGVQATAGYYHGSSEVDAPWVFWTFAPGVAQDNKPIWYSETGGAANPWINGSGQTVGNGAITVALKMFNALVHSNATAYIHWQFSDGGNSVTEHTLLNGATLDDPLSSNKYVAFNHFSRFVRPGAERIASTFDNGNASVGGASQYDTLHSVNVAAFLHEEDQKLVYVLLNMTSSAETITINVPEGLGLSTFAYTRSSETEQFAQLDDLAVDEGQLSFSMPRYSLVTLVGDAPQLGGLLGDFNGDGIVDGADFLAWQRGESSSPLSIDDLTNWEASFGLSPAAVSDAMVVPEPSTLLLLSGVGIALSKVMWRQWYMASIQMREPVDGGGVFPLLGMPQK